MTQPILTRIRIMDKDGNDLWETTDKEQVENLGLEIDSTWKDIYRMNIGTIIPRNDGKKLKVINITSNLYTITDKLDLSKGINTCVYG